MRNEEFIEINETGWDNLIKSGKPFSNTILPEYGPFLKRNEESLNLFKNIKGASVLDLGCGAGESLKYLYNKGASTVWGIDISKEQIKKAKEAFNNFKNNFYVSPMEIEVDIPKNYFDYIISIFSIGYTSDLKSTLKNVYNYLKENGLFIISWTHPFYYCLDFFNGDVIVDKSYFDEESEVISKGPDKIKLMQKNLMISTIINEAIKVGFNVEKILEEETELKDDVNGYISNFWKKEKTTNCPSTIIYVFKKKNYTYYK